MYKAGFVANVVHRGNILSDENGTVALLFGSEYKLRLKNKNDRDAVAKVIIDGKEATERGDLIIHANDTVELERFVESVYSGRKFKFVSLDDVSSRERDNPKNGMIEVRFRLTKRPTERIIYHHPLVEEHHYYYPRKVIHWTEPPWTPNIWCSSTGGTKGLSGGLTYDSCGAKGLTYGDASITTTGNINNAFYCSNSTSGVALNNSSVSCSADISDVSDGKTVEGSYSGQSFSYGYIGELEDHETVIRLKLVGYEDDDEIKIKPNQTELKKYCSGCGITIWNSDDKFCSKCGKKLS